MSFRKIPNITELTLHISEMYYHVFCHVFIKNIFDHNDSWFFSNKDSNTGQKSSNANKILTLKSFPNKNKCLIKYNLIRENVSWN